jgi:hypothetical protein
VAFVLGGPGYVVIGGTTMALDIPGAIYVYPRGLNADDQVAGASYDANDVASGFYTDSDGVCNRPSSSPTPKTPPSSGLAMPAI